MHAAAEAAEPPQEPAANAALGNFGLPRGLYLAFGAHFLDLPPKISPLATSFLAAPSRRAQQSPNCRSTDRPNASACWAPGTQGPHLVGGFLNMNPVEAGAGGVDRCLRSVRGGRLPIRGGDDDVTLVPHARRGREERMEAGVKLLLHRRVCPCTANDDAGQAVRPPPHGRHPCAVLFMNRGAPADLYTPDLGPGAARASRARLPSHGHAQVATALHACTGPGVGTTSSNETLSHVRPARARGPRRCRMCTPQTPSPQSQNPLTPHLADFSA